MEGIWQGGSTVEANRTAGESWDRLARIQVHQHGERTLRALEILKRPENRMEVVDLALPCGGGTISLIGIKDCDPERNLGD
ncbi:MAG: hypothetical protein ACPLTR_10995, partial [Thermacetogeniaceae bacterium]